MRRALAATLPLAAASLWAGGSGLNVLVVVNQASSNSVQLGTYYCERRQIPPQNVLRITWTGGNVAWTLSQFQSALATPLANALASRGLSAQIDTLALSMDIPYRVTSGTEANSTTAVLFYGFKTHDLGSSGPCRLASSAVNAYAGSEREFRSGLPGANPGTFLTAMLTGNTLAEAMALVDQGVASDGAFPTQTVRLAKTTDSARNVRFFTFDNAIFEARVHGGIALTRVDSNQTAGLSDLLGLQTGLAQFDVSPNTFVPGALADSLTSYGGRLFETHFQTNLLAFIRAGAAGSYGTVVEPCNYLEKFPDPMAYFYLARGFGLAESYYQSLASPYQGLIVGEPLAAPFAAPGRIAWIDLPANPVLSGTAQLRGVADAADPDRPLDQVDLFIDGVLAATLTRVPPTAGNELTVTLNGSAVNYVVPAGATLASVAAGLASQINTLTPLTQVQAEVRGDRLRLAGLDPWVAGSSIAVETGHAGGGGTELTTFVRGSRPTLLDSAARGRRAFTITGTSVAGDELRLTMTKTNGAQTTVRVVNGAPPVTTVQLTRQLLSLVNATPALQGADGVSAEDTYTQGTTNIQFLLYARSPGFGPAQAQIALEGSATFDLDPAAPHGLDQNRADLQPRNHIALTAGTTHLPLTFPLDTTTLADGYHELTLAAYEGSHARVQTRAAQTIRVRNTSLAATFTSPAAGRSVALGSTLNFTVVANATDIARIDLFGTGGLLASITGQSSATFALPGVSLDLGLHRFHALVTASTGATYRTETLSVRLVPVAPPTAVVIESFAAEFAATDRVVLRWQTGVELALIGYHIERQERDGAWRRLTPHLLPAGSASLPGAYGFDDTAPPRTESVRYRLLGIDRRGQPEVLAETSARAGLAATLRWSAAGLVISVQGARTGRVIVESATDVVRGPWLPVAALDLNGHGSEPLSLGIPHEGRSHFYRVRQDEPCLPCQNDGVP